MKLRVKRIILYSILLVLLSANLTDQANLKPNHKTNQNKKLNHIKSEPFELTADQAAELFVVKY